MGRPRTVRLDDDVDQMMELFVKKNDINFNKLVNLAVKEFIKRPHSIELEPVDPSEWNKNLKKSFGKHKKAMKELAK